MSPVKCLAISPDSSLLLAIDEEGQSVLFNVKLRVFLGFFNFQEPVSCVKFSPDGTRLAAAIGRKLQLWFTPSSERREFAPFVLDQTVSLHRDGILDLCWTLDSRYILTTSADMSAKIFPACQDGQNVRRSPLSLIAHKHRVVAGFFYATRESKLGILTLGQDGVAYQWLLDTDNFKLLSREDSTGFGTRRLLSLNGDAGANAANMGHVTASSFCPSNNTFLVGLQSGAFALYRIAGSDELELVHALSVSQNAVHAVALNFSGEWVAFASASDVSKNSTGSVVVWDWKAESFVMKQQGHLGKHSSLILCLDFSADSTLIATGGRDGKVKIWSALTGFCISTFSDHSGEVTSVRFSKNNRVLLSASSDGTIRAVDLIRYRHFKTLTTPRPVQFSCMEADASGELVMAGTHDTWEIFVWSLQTGVILDVLAGHSGPIQKLHFDPVRQRLVSASWDRTIRTWDLYSREKHVQSLSHDSEVLSVSFHPSGQEMAAATLKGDVCFWDSEEGSLKRVIEAHHDVWVKPESGATQLAKNAEIAFTSCAYSPDGTAMLLAGRCPFVVLYDVESKVVLKRFSLTSIPHRRQSSHESSLKAHRGQVYKSGGPALECFDVKFASTGRLWAAATSEGLMIYSLQDTVMFDPFDLDIECTPAAIEEAISGGNLIRALVLALKLSNHGMTAKAWLQVPSERIDGIARDLPIKYVSRLLHFIAACPLNRQCALTANGRPIWAEMERVVTWVNSIVHHHHRALRTEHPGCPSNTATLRTIQKGLQDARADFCGIIDENRYLIQALQCRQQV